MTSCQINPALIKLLNQFLMDRRVARSYKTIQKYGARITLFLNFIAEKRILLQDSSVDTVMEYEQYLLKKMRSINTGIQDRTLICSFVRWLKEKGHLYPPGLIHLAPDLKRCQMQGVLVKLPKLATEYIDLIQVNSKSTTVNGYKLAMKYLYLFLKKARIPVSKVKRRHIEKLLKEFKKRNLGPIHRHHLITHIRCYLEWLYIHGEIQIPSKKLILKTDFPKRPKMLPKPYPAEFDNELQKRLNESTDLYCKGLLLMRLTGIRSGELLSLSYDCLNEDGRGGFYLKIPLGKLNSERMVPIDSDTASLCQSIREQTRSHLKSPGPKYLLSRPTGAPLTYRTLVITINRIATSLDAGGPVGTHRLRHTYACWLLNGGLSLVSLKEILGHRSLYMTLGYAKATPETIRNEYLAAVQKLTERYKGFKNPRDGSDPAHHLVNDLIVTLKTRLQDLNPHPLSARTLKNMIKRLQRIEAQISTVLGSH